jgi:hypothetical protein
MDYNTELLRTWDAHKGDSTSAPGLEFCDGFRGGWQAASQEVERLRQICTNAHDQLLRGADDNELLALLASGWKQRAGE